MDHPQKGVLCDPEEETINHLLVGCPFTRQFWYTMLSRVGLQMFFPQPEDTVFDTWWEKASRDVPELSKNGLNSLVALDAWTIWTHRNDIVFEGSAPNLDRAISWASDARRLWKLQVHAAWHPCLGMA